MASLQIRSTQISPELPSQVMLLFDRPMRDVLPNFYRQLVSYHNHYINLIALLETQPQASQDIHTHKNILFLPTGSTVAVHRENGGSCTYGTIIGHETENHIDRSYRVRVTRTGHAITRIKRHIKPSTHFQEIISGKTGKSQTYTGSK